MRVFKYPTKRNKPGDLIRAGDAANLAHNWKAAETAYAEALRQTPSLSHIWVQYGHSLKEQGLFVGTEAAYRRSLRLESTNGDTFLQLGHVLKLQSRLREAREAYAEALMLDPTLSDARAELDRPTNETPTGAVNGVITEVSAGGITPGVNAAAPAEKSIRVPFDPETYAEHQRILADLALMPNASGNKTLSLIEFDTELIEENFYTAMCGEFDPLFYWKMYPDIFRPEIDPIEHFHHFGWREGRDP
jgi:tetratricopeptide (TPR) repeat protein